MSSKSFKYKPIYPGFQWEITLRLASAEEIFPDGATFRADFRVNPNSPVLASVTTEAGGITRLDGNRVAILLGGTQSAAMVAGSVMFDLIRTDTAEPRHLGVRVKVPVEKSVTAA